MSVIGSNILAGASGQGGGYNLTNSLRFRGGSVNASLTRTPSTSSNRRTWTWSGWIKLGSKSDGYFPLFGADANGYPCSGISLTNFNINFFSYTPAAYDWQKISTMFLRDPSAWYHIVAVTDTTNATAEDRAIVYVNGQRVTSWSTNNNPSLNFEGYVNSSSYVTKLGRIAGFDYFDGYMAEVNFVDGQVLTPSSFGQTSTSTGVWIPKKYTGTYGTNGFYVKFTDTTSTSTLGTDFSGNGNTFTVNNISLTAGSTYDSMTDVPTLTSATAANYCTLNPLFNPNGSIVTYSNGNLNFSHSSGTANQMPVQGTIALPAGKFYWEYTVGATVNDQVGIATAVVVGGSADGTAGARYINSGAFQSNYTTPASAASYTTGDVIGMAYDQPNGTLAFYKTNSLQGTITAISTTEVFFPSRSPNSSGSGGAGSFNFGQQPFTYTPPSGFVALNTFNLPTPTIGATATTTANKYMNIALYTGTGSSQSITGLGFQPDWTWIKERNAAADHGLYDAVRGVQLQLESNTTTAETTETTGLTAFGSDGFTVGALAQLNTSADTYVAWNWKANGAGVSNTDGTITSTVSASTTAGFSIVTYTGTGADATVGHGLGVAPSMVIVKIRSAGGNDWQVYHSALGQNKILQLNLTTSVDTVTNYWYNGTTSTVFGVNGSYSGINSNGATYVAYCFAPVAGYSAFGSYTGNGSGDGPFIYTGFRPRFFMTKCTSSTGDWHMTDTARYPTNSSTSMGYLDANTSAAEGNFNIYDGLSNGFKIRDNGSVVNGSGATYIYMAFCESPFKFSNAR
jgi:hypothetical protein